ncbi:MAG: glycosyltransferase family 4 protein [Solirubrobacteraceae bacterium]|jgi:glycosyltransferase involved in cell wall biosynthesis
MQTQNALVGGYCSRDGAQAALKFMTAPSLHEITTLPRDAERRALRVAMLAPPWITVPPPGYGGIEAVVALLCEELVSRGHDVTLFAAPGSHSAARVCSPLQGTHPDEIGSSLYESDHVAAAYDAIDRAATEARPFDVVHDHSGFTALAMADRVSVPVVHTLHGPFSPEMCPFYERHGHKARLVAISHFQLEHAPSGVCVADVVPNPIRVEDWPFREDKDDYLLWMGRMDPIKGAHRAIAAARAAGMRLVLAGPVQPGQETYFHSEIEAHVDGRNVVFAGEVGGVRRKDLFARAKAFLMPISWPEPFGMVMVEALACGTPVIAFPEGAAGEIVLDGENGFHVADVQAMAEATRSLEKIDAARCRRSVASRYDAAIVAAGYEDVYYRAIRPEAGAVPRFTRNGQPASRAEAIDPTPHRAARASILQPAS